MDQIQIVILAAGHGKRMESELPKVLIPLRGKPMVMHVLDAIKSSGICDRPTVVVGQKRELVMKALGDAVEYAIQENQLGTGYAVLAAKEKSKKAKHVLVLYGDHPLVSASTIKKLSEKHLKSGAKITFASAVVTNFEDWRKTFLHFGRILRDGGMVVSIKEYKDASGEEREIKEINPGYYIFEANWLWENLEKIENNNAQKEYYLTDLFHIATTEKEKIENLEIDPHEALGANSREELEILESLTL